MKFVREIWLCSVVKQIDWTCGCEVEVSYVALYF